MLIFSVGCLRHRPRRVRHHVLHGRVHRPHRVCLHQLPRHVHQVSLETIFQLSFAGNTTQQYLWSPTNIQYSLVRNCTNQQWFSKSNLQKTEASRSSEGSGNARLCDVFSWGCICLLFSWYIFYHWKNFCFHHNCRPWMTWHGVWQRLWSTLRSWQRHQM